MGFFIEFLKTGISPIFAETLIYQRYRVRRKYKLIDENMRLSKFPSS